jgi:hypothetical protein
MPNGKKISLKKIESNNKRILKDFFKEGKYDELNKIYSNLKTNLKKVKRGKGVYNNEKIKSFEKLIKFYKKERIKNLFQKQDFKKIFQISKSTEKRLATEKDSKKISGYKNFKKLLKDEFKKIESLITSEDLIADAVRSDYFVRLQDLLKVKSNLKKENKQEDFFSKEELNELREKFNKKEKERRRKKAERNKVLKEQMGRPKIVRRFGKNWKKDEVGKVSKKSKIRLSLNPKLKKLFNSLKKDRTIRLKKEKLLKDNKKIKNIGI